MKPAVWIGILFGVLVIGAVAVSSFRSQPYHVRVCITFNSRTDCRSASAQTRAEAQRAATTAACSQISGGVTESMQCENTRPDSVDWR
jgi:hypothetical protein